MVLASRLLALCCAALVVAGAAGALSISTGPGSVSRRASGASPVPAAGGGSGGSGGAGASGGAGGTPTSAQLAAGLIQPVDMGGYYHPSPAVESGLLDANRCLAGIDRFSAPTGHAAEGLATGDLYSVPEIVEVVTAYPGEQSQSVYDALGAAIGGCGRFGFDFDATAVSGPLVPEPLSTSAAAGRAWAVTFDYSGVSFELQMGLVRQGQEVFFVGWMQAVAVPPAEKIMGNFQSTVALAIGEEA